MKVYRAFILGVIALACLTASAEAHPNRHRHHYHHHHAFPIYGNTLGSASFGARPRAWCGYFMRQYLGVSNPAGNLARWWAGYGQPSGGPAVGTVVVWSHHVGIITGQASNGQWIVKSGNDGHVVRERPRSVASAIAFRWPA